MVIVLGYRIFYPPIDYMPLTQAWQVSTSTIDIISKIHMIKLVTKRLVTLKSQL